MHSALNLPTKAVRGVCRIIFGAVLPALSSGPRAAEVNLLRNPGLEQIGKDGRPVYWETVDFRTGGEGRVVSISPHTGKHCVQIITRTPRQRACWRQKVALPAGASVLEIRAWYRAERAAPRGKAYGPSIRVLFHRSLVKWDEISLKQTFFPVSTTWREARTIVKTPPETRAVVVELFRWFTPGTTWWDDAFLRVVPPEEVSPVMFFEPGTEIDRAPTLGRNLPYTPADSSVVETNPPRFIWLPSGRDSRYFLEVAQAPRFTGHDVLRFGPTPWCCKMLSQALSPGVWYWRYAVQRPGMKAPAWSQARRFTVPKDAAPHPYPKPEAFRVPGQRPHLLLLAARVPELRRRAATGDLRSIAETLARRVRREIDEELPPEPDFLPKDRKKRSPAYVTIFRATRPPMDGMERAALAYLLTGDRAFGFEAKRRILHFFAWDPKGSTCVFHNDEPAMWVMMRGVRAYDWTYDLFTPEERAQIEKVMRVRAADFYTLLRRMPFENNPFSSHPGRIIGFLGEAAIEFLPEWPEARKWLDYITRIYWGVYPAWGKEDGGWNEGPGYWAAYMTFALHFVLGLREACGIDLTQRPFFRNTPYYRLYLTPPYSNMAPFGDGTQFKPSRPVGLMYDFSSLLHDPHIRWYCEEAGRPGPAADVLGILLKDDSLPGRTPFELQQARFFPGVGLVCLHTDFALGDNNVEFAMRSSPYGAVSHGHNDQNCFVLEAFGEPLAIASGYYNYYSSPHHDRWTRQTKGKCGITFDGGIGQERGWEARGRVTHFVHGEGFDAVVGDATEAYGGRLSRVRRTVVHVRPGVFVIHDALRAPEPHRFEYWLHALDRMAVDVDKREVRIQRPKASLAVRFLDPAKVAFHQTDRFDPPPKWPPDRKFPNNWHLTASLTEPAEFAEFLTVLLPSRSDRKEELPETRKLSVPNGAGAQLQWMDGRRVFVLSRSLDPAKTGNTVTVGELRTDGRLCALGFSRNGQLERALLAEGTVLERRGKDVVKLDTVGTVTVNFDTTGGRIDFGIGPHPAVEITLPRRPVAVTDSGARPVPFRFAGDRLLLPAACPGQIVVWSTAPVAPGRVPVVLQVGNVKKTVDAVRFGRDWTGLEARVPATPGLYSLDPGPSTGVEWLYPKADATGHTWVKDSVHVCLRSTRPLDSVTLHLDCAAAVLAGQPSATCPRGPRAISVEAENDWHENGGRIRVSRGKHTGVSGKDNLWAWNTPGHALWWDIAVPTAGAYELWVIGTTETGLLAEIQLGSSKPVSAFFSPTGGWGRKDARQWRAFHVLTARHTPARFHLPVGTARLRLVNRSGLGLNLDRFVLVRSP